LLFESDVVYVLTLGTSYSNSNAGSASYATAKFVDVGKKLASPREFCKSINDILMPPVLETYRIHLASPRKVKTLKLQDVLTRRGILSYMAIILVWNDGTRH
jgi:hypothetical protein